MMEKLTINTKWVLKHLPIHLSVAILLLSILSSFEGAINGYVFGQLPNLKLNDSSALIQFGLKVVLAYVVTYTSLFLFLIVTQKATEALNVQLKTVYFTSVFDRSLEVENISSADALNEVTGSAKRIESNYFKSLFMLVQCIMTVISSLIVVLGTNMVLGLIYIVLSLLSLVPSMIGGKKMNRITNNWSSSNQVLLQTIRDIFSGRLEITNFGVKHIFFKQYDVKLKEEERRYFKLNAFQFVLQYIAWLFAVLTIIVPIAIGLYFASHHLFGVTISAILTLSLTGDRVIGGVRELTEYQAAIKSTDALRTITVPVQTTGDTQRPSDSSGGLKIHNASVKRGDKTIFSEINLHLNHGEKVVITGPSGVGKSTLLNAIANPKLLETGSITYDGTPIVASDFAFISQKPWLFAGTLRDNVTLFEQFDDQDVMAALRQVGLVAELGDDLLDRQVAEDGTNLSGGQAQRLSIARGLLRHRQLFLCDEITSSLDEKNADEIHQLIYSMPSTVIEVAHHFNKDLAQGNQVAVLILSKTALTHD